MYVYICLSAEVLKTFLGPGYLGSEDEIVSLWHFLVNFDIYGSLFHLAMVQSQCLMAIRMECGLITLCHSCRIYIYIYIYTCIIKKPGQKRWEGPLKQFPPLRMSHQVNTRNTDYYIQHKIRSQNFFFEKHFRSSVFQAVV